jgi:hypothetical protein
MDQESILTVEEVNSAEFTEQSKRGVEEYHKLIAESTYDLATVLQRGVLASGSSPNVSLLACCRDWQDRGGGQGHEDQAGN